MAHNIASMDSNLIKDGQVSNDIELFVNVDQSPDDVAKFKSDLIIEQHRMFLAIQSEVDECEKLSGTWDPAIGINNLYEALDRVHDDIDEFNENNKDGKTLPTPSNRDSVIPA